MDTYYLATHLKQKERERDNLTRESLYPFMFTWNCFVWQNSSRSGISLQQEQTDVLKANIAKKP